MYHFFKGDRVKIGEFRLLGRLQNRQWCIAGGEVNYCKIKLLGMIGSPLDVCVDGLTKFPAYMDLGIIEDAELLGKRPNGRHIRWRQRYAGIEQQKITVPCNLDGNDGGIVRIDEDLPINRPDQIPRNDSLRRAWSTSWMTFCDHLRIYRMNANTVADLEVIALPKRNVSRCNGD